MSANAEMLDAVRGVKKLSPLIRRLNAAKVRDDKSLSEAMKSFVLLALEHPERVERILLEEQTA